MNLSFLLFFLLFLKKNNCEESMLNEDYVMCEENDTCSTLDDLNSTESVTVSTIFEPNNATNQTAIDEKNNTFHSIDYDSIYDNDVCFCNLEEEYCDINCCCDQDCTTDQKSIFSSCKIGLSNSYDSRYCYSSDYVYVNNTPTSIEVIQNELFCIMSSNLPPSYLIQASKPVKSIPEAEKLIAKYRRWPNNINTENYDFNITEVLKDGNNIWVRYNNSKIEQFHLPQNMITNVCLSKKPIKFLDNFKSSCSHMINEDISEDLYPITYYDFSVIAFNSSWNFSLIEDISKECSKNICLPININLCDENYNDCEQVKKNDTRLNHGCRFSLYSSEQTCSQIVKRVKYNFFHNGTEGFTKINLYLHLTNITFYISNENEQFEQYFEVNFFWHNQKQKLSSILSGNPGYLIGKPILIANVNCSTLNITDEKKFAFIKNYYNVADNFLLLPENVNGYCKLNNDTYKLVDFGYNRRLNCKENFILKNKTSGGTQICIELQKQVLQLWNISQENDTSSFKYIATLGNSKRNNIDEWIELMYKFNINETFDKINSKYHDENKIICNGLANTLKINILYSNIDFDKAKNQKKIVNVFMELNTINTTLYLDDKINERKNSSLDFRVYTEVMFYDITAPKLQKFVDPPSFEIKVPRDFFYPFMSGNGIGVKNNYVLIIILFIIHCI